MKEPQHTKLTAEQLAERAEVKESDTSRAAAAWKRHAPARFKNLLDAVPEKKRPRG